MVKVYSRDYCPYCDRAKIFFKERGIDFEEIDLTGNFDEMAKIKESTGWQTFPIIFIGDKLIGGYTDLKALDESGELNTLLK